MKQIQPFQKHWLQITSIVVCRLKAADYQHRRLPPVFLKRLYLLHGFTIIISFWGEMFFFSRFYFELVNG